MTCGIIAASRSFGPVCEDTIAKRLQPLAKVRGFVMSEFLELVHLHRPAWFWAGWAKGKPAPHGFARVFNILAHPLRVKTQTVDFQSRKGAESMTTRTPKKGQSTPTQATTTDPQQLLADALNAAAMSKWYLKRGDIAAAQRKTVQAMKAMNELRKMEGGAK